MNWITPIIKNISEHVENLYPYLYEYTYTQIRFYPCIISVVFLVTQINNECLARWIFNGILCKHCVTLYLLRKKESFKDSSYEHKSVYFFLIIILSNQGYSEVQEDSPTAQKMIIISQSSRSRLGSCQGT